jgi:uncharacterized damage-inducible protein DinB
MKPLLVALVAVTLPVTLLAQPAPPANPITANFAARIGTLERNVAQAFDSIPASLFGYKPTPAQLTIGYVAQHVATDNYFFCNNYGAMKATIDPKDTTTPDSVKATWPKAELVAKMKASFAFCQSASAQLTDATLAEQISITFGGNTRTVTRSSMVLGHALDMADHYSQISNYMRLNGMLPPTALPRPPRPGN